MTDLTNKFTVPMIDPSLQHLEIGVPIALRPSLQANKHLVPRFKAGIQEALEHSFMHPDTRMRGDITRSEIKDRVDLCYKALIEMHCEQGMSLIHALDLLPNVIIDALRMAAGTGDLTDEKPRMRWGGKGTEPQEKIEVDPKSDLNADPIVGDPDV